MEFGGVDLGVAASGEVGSTLTSRRVWENGRSDKTGIIQMGGPTRIETIPGLAHANVIPADANHLKVSLSVPRSGRGNMRNGGDRRRQVGHLANKLLVAFSLLLIFGSGCARQ